MKSTPPGTCGLCNEVVTYKAVSHHLQKCLEARRSPGGSPVEAFDLAVEGGGGPYWLRLAAPADSKLLDLDRFLRRIWLDCCGHMSAFTIDGQRFAGSPMDSSEKSMSSRADKVLKVGETFLHEYDFGSTTELNLKVVGKIAIQKQKKGPILLLARNQPPEIKCVKCKGTATDVCSNCMWSGKGWLCKKCSRSHECGEEMLLPVVNSPRVGMCGYTGVTSAPEIPLHMR